MSLLTEVVIYAAMPSRDVVASVNALEFDGQSFQQIDRDLAGGHKVFCGAVWMACFNYVSPDRITDALTMIDWGYGEPFVCIDYECDDEARVWRPSVRPTP